jgi:hypothetical protein
VPLRGYPCCWGRRHNRAAGDCRGERCAPSRHPDADLLALIERAKIADSISTDADIFADELLDEKTPSFPSALIWSEADVPHWHRVGPGEHISSQDVDFLREWLKRPTRFDRPRPPDLPWSPLIPLSAFTGRAREIVRSKDEFEAAWQAAKEHPDVLEAKAQYEALYERWCELAKRVATTPAKTAEGLISKITLIASRYSEDDLDGTYDGILASAALDAQALTSAKIEEARS